MITEPIPHLAGVTYLNSRPLMVTLHAHLAMHWKSWSTPSQLG